MGKKDFLVKLENAILFLLLYVLPNVFVSFSAIKASVRLDLEKNNFS